MAKTINVQYFAALREQRGSPREDLNTEAQTYRALYRELKERHGFRLSEDVVKVAVNDEFRDMDERVADNDAVVFIPPVAGG